MNDLMSSIRSRFLKFFEEKNHLVLKSAPLIPQNDPTLLFINAGMAPLKGYFLDQETPPAINLVSCQKCIRAGGKHNDLDQVGYTKRHHTFFEMCGNFSFGGYEQQGAIELAWEFLTKELKLNTDKLWITVHPEDHISYKIWAKIVQENRIVKLTENEWSMGGDGPCGMCTEIFYDHGEHISGTIEDGDRFVEVWNIVFMTHQVRDGAKSELPKICIDTGMGLDRIVAIMSGTEDNYSTPLFRSIMQKMSDLTGKPICSDYKIIADHARAAVFAISDGIIPDVSSRGYVIRKIIRRALVHSHPYGIDLLKLAAEYMIGNMGQAYPELFEYKELILTVLDDEKQAIDTILDNGCKLVIKTLKDREKHNKLEDLVSGETLFFLHDTHGLPIEVVCSILEQMGLKPDLESYENIAKSSRVSQKSTLPAYDAVSKFIGYEKLECDATLLEQTSVDGQQIFVFDITPFYAESGGQESDSGYIISDSEKILITSVKKVGNTILHISDSISSSGLTIGNTYRLAVNPKRRAGLRKHHSATHLLLAALRKNLGPHVIQKGSLVREDSLRFDFLHNSPVDKDTLKLVEEEVNNSILSSATSLVEVLSKKDAEARGAIATFGEKYGDTVRVVSIGPSVEFCGGTHVENSGEIGSFYILKEKGVAGGVRRIEAVAGEAAYKYAHSQIDLVRRLANGLRVQESILEQTVLEKKKDAEQQKIEIDIQKLNVSGYSCCLCYCIGATHGSMLKLTDEHIKENDLVLVANVMGEKTMFVLKTKDLDATKVLKSLLHDFGGHCGGKANISQGGTQHVLSKEQLIKSLDLLDTI